MFNMRQCGEGRWAAERHRHHRGFRGHGRHGRDGAHNDDGMRLGRMLAQGDLRLITLALIAEQPRHGYELIKVIEEKTSGWYSPSPGIVYPTLTFLEDVGYLTAQSEGAKKLYTITEEGRAHLEQNRDLASAVLDRLAAIGEKFSRFRERREAEDRGREAMPRSVRGAFEDLAEAVRDVLKNDGAAKGRVITIIDEAIAAMRRN